MDRYEIVSRLSTKLAEVYSANMNSVASYGDDDYKVKIGKLIDLTEEYSHVFKCLMAAAPVEQEDKKKCCCKD